MDMFSCNDVDATDYEKAEVYRQLCPNEQYSVRTGSRDIWVAGISIAIIFFSCVVAVVIIVSLFGLFYGCFTTNEDVYNIECVRYGLLLL